MPQINQFGLAIYSQLFWLILVFGIVYFGIARRTLPKVEETIQARAKRIADDLAAAEAARAKADADEEAYRAGLAEARARAVKATQEAKAESAREAEAKVKAADALLAGKAGEADARLKAAKAEALAGIEAVAADAARDIVARLSSATVSESEAAAAVKSALAAAA